MKNIINQSIQARACCTKHMSLLIVLLIVQLVASPDHPVVYSVVVVVVVVVVAVAAIVAKCQHKIRNMRKIIDHETQNI